METLELHYPMIQFLIIRNIKVPKQSETEGSKAATTSRGESERPQKLSANPQSSIEARDLIQAF